MKALIFSTLLVLSPLVSTTACASQPVKKEKKQMQERFTLYYRSSCPYCFPVVKLIHSLKLPIPCKDISKSEAARLELIRIGGKQQVPCLVIDNFALYESKDILNYLQKRFQKKA